MQRKNALKKKRVITASLAGLLTAAIVGTALYNDSSVALARPSLPGVETIVNENSTQKPFKILEIVDDYDSARIGYTIANEEPGYYDAVSSQAISDMASLAERADKYKTGSGAGTTDPAYGSVVSKGIYDELVGKAFTYNEFQESETRGDAATKFTKDTEGAVNGKIYGTFEPNTTEPASGLYEAADQAGDYLKIKISDTDEETKNNLSIEDIYRRIPGSDQSGIFYMNYIAFIPRSADDDATVEHYDVEAYDKITPAESWKYPFRIDDYTDQDTTGKTKYTIVTTNPDGSTVSNDYYYRYYDKKYYTFNDPIEAEREDVESGTTPSGTTPSGTTGSGTTPSGTTPSGTTGSGTTPSGSAASTVTYNYKLANSSSLMDGDLIYLKQSDKLSYFGYIMKNSADELVFVDVVNGVVGHEHPLEGSEVEGADTDDSLAKLIVNEGYSGGTSQALCTVRVADESEEVDLYHISKVTLRDTGRLKAVTSFNPVNDPTQNYEDFGIRDESEENWYHVWYYKKGEIDPYVYRDGRDGKYDFVHDYTKEEVNSFYYKGGFSNNEWFKREVLDVEPDKYKDICIDVITKKLGDVTADDISSASLVYFTYGSDSLRYSDDISYEAAKALLEGVYNDNLPVVLNLRAALGAYNKQQGATINSSSPNVKIMMALLTLDEDNFNHIPGWLGDNGFVIPTSSTVDGARLQEFVTNGTDNSHVAHSVFVNDDRAGSTNGKNAIADDFTTAYSDAKVSGGYTVATRVDGVKRFNYSFEQVKKDIDEELFYLEVAGKDTNSFNSTISKATCIRYILNYGDRRTVGKTEIRVLDIEPYYYREIEARDNADSYFATKYYYDGDTAAQVVRDIFKKNWFASNVSSTTEEENIEVTGMGTKEFIGKIEDLNENYDLIYFGMDTSYMVTDIRNVQTGVDGRGRPSYTMTKTKDVLTNGGGNPYVYRHTGDTATTNGLDGTDGTFYFSGNDITPDKLRELQNYIKAGYAMILSDDFFTYDTQGRIPAVNKDRDEYGIDKNRVDENSYIYELIKWIREEGYLYKNVEIKRNFGDSTSTAAAVATTDGRSVADHRENFVKYLNISKLELEVLEQPPLYNPYDVNDPNYHQYIEMNSSGKYAMEFKIRLTNDAAVDTTNTTYDCKLYIDHDGDGRFEEVELLDSLYITTDEGSVVSPDSNGRFNLVTGTTYNISRNVPEGFIGCIPWKLVFQENRSSSDEVIKVAVQDFSAIRDLSQRQPIKVLQLTSEGSDTTELNLWSDSQLLGYYDQVVDFKIEVDHEKANNFVDRKGLFQNVDRLEKLCEYDIIVMGFLDGWRFKYNETNAKDATMAIRAYMLSGRSILFTHDLTSLRVYPSDSGRSWGGGLNWGYLANLYLRDIQGMDRYHWTEQFTQDLTYTNSLTGITQTIEPYISRYDTKIPGAVPNQIDRNHDNINILGYADGNILRYNNSTYGEFAKQNDKKVDNDNERLLNNVARVNRGQMTEYPFRIGDLEKIGDKYYAKEVIPVANTHHQYFQLDLETDYLDENYDDDIVVWYTLSLDSSKGNSYNYYKYNYNDVRNNYYIYNKGNITYTGAGHSTINGEIEKKLFVNTLVASYNAGTHAPYAAYKSDASVNAADITSMYLPYDISLAKDVDDGGVDDGYLDDTVTVYYKTINNNLQDNKKPLVAQYYVDVPTGGDIVVGGKNYKIVSPVEGSVKECRVNLDGSITYIDVADPHILENGKTYKMEFRVDDVTLNINPNERYHGMIYTRMRAQTKGTEDLTQDLRDLAATGTFTALPASDSFKPLNINFTQLYDLK